MQHDFMPTWLNQMHVAWSRIYVGIDHHSRQITVAAASGEQFQTHQGAKDSRWIPTTVFTQDGLGYLECLDWLAQLFPGVPKDRFVFLAEPTFAKMFSAFLVAAGFEPGQVLWVKTTEVGLYRRAKGIAKAGKNDADDARTLACMAFEATASPHERLNLFQAAPGSPLTSGLQSLAKDHQRLTELSVSLQNRITDLVVRLFPECRRVFNGRERLRKPDGTVCEQRVLNLFGGTLPLKILEAYPTARSIAEAGFERLWQEFGGVGFRKQQVRELVELAGQSGGLDQPVDARRLQLLIGEYRQVQARLAAYREAMAELLASDPVLASLGEIACLGPVALAEIVGTMGEVSRFEGVEKVKRYLNVAPVPMPQTGRVDERGCPVQVWRMGANSYKTVNGKRHLVYRNPGIKGVRVVAYQWFETLVKNARHRPNDPFVQLYLRLKAQHQGKVRWLGKVRWKVIGKLVSVIYHCLRKGVSYDPSQVLGQPTPNLAA